MYKKFRLGQLTAFLIGILAAASWFHYRHPMQPLFVDIYNGTGNLLQEVAIKHGKADLQEHIQVLRIEPGEHRKIALNHEPGLGFNVEATLENGRQFSICAGKNDTSYIRVTVTSGGLIPEPLR